jgi:hypothetical protein
MSNPKRHDSGASEGPEKVAEDGPGIRRRELAKEVVGQTQSPSLWNCCAGADLESASRKCRVTAFRSTIRSRSALSLLRCDGMKPR